VAPTKAELEKNNRIPDDSDVDHPEYFLTDFIHLTDPKDDLKSFMTQGLGVRPFFEDRTGWDLVLSGRTLTNTQILNFWRLPNTLDAVPKGLMNLAKDPNKSVAFFKLLDLFDREYHFITHSIGKNSLLPKVAKNTTFYFVYVEYWLQYGKLSQFLTDFRVGLDSFAPPWQYIANVRAISGRVNTVCQYWLRRAPADADPVDVQREVRREIEEARWEGSAEEKDYRRQRVDLLIPTLFDPTTTPRKEEEED
jgi:hypothetical protein